MTAAVSAEPPPREQVPPSLPQLPAGLGEAEEPDTDSDSETPGRPWWSDYLTGFAEARAGVRLREDELQKTMTIGEARLRLEGEWESGAAAAFRVANDFVYDPVEADHAVDLDTGRGAIDLREVNAVFRPFGFVDLKVGRQILTWGTGDLVFLNDLFPKDFRAFFIGRDDEYLKAPSDAVRASFFSSVANLDLVYTPRFDADRFIDGSRLSYFQPQVDSIVGRNAVAEPVRPDAWFEDDEIAARAYRQIGSYEAAAYVYRGFWKSPVGALGEGTPFFPGLSAYGASVRGPLARGIASAEFAAYDSLDDEAGSDPLIPNGELRTLVGFEREVVQELTIGVQYYAERRADFDALLEALPQDAPAPHRSRHMLTLRVTKLALRQNLTTSVFGFWSPNEGDGHIRARVGYKVTDAWLVEGGTIVMSGPRDSPFGQLRDNSGVFAAVRRTF